MTTKDTYDKITSICDKRVIIYCTYEDVTKLEFGFEDGFTKVTIEFLEHGYLIETPLGTFNFDDIYQVNLEVKTIEYMKEKEDYLVLSIGDGISWNYKINLWSYEV